MGLRLHRPLQVRPEHHQAGQHHQARPEHHQTGQHYQDGEAGQDDENSNVEEEHLDTIWVFTAASSTLI